MIVFQFYALGVPRDSPLRRTHSLFWNTRTNDEGIPREGSFHGLANAGKISFIAPARVAKFGSDGHSVVLEDGRVLPAAAVILATGYESTWRSIFDSEWVHTWRRKCLSSFDRRINGTSRLGPASPGVRNDAPLGLREPCQPARRTRGNAIGCLNISRTCSCKEYLESGLCRQRSYGM